MSTEQEPKKVDLATDWSLLESRLPALGWAARYAREVLDAGRADWPASTMPVRREWTQRALMSVRWEAVQVIDLIEQALVLQRSCLDIREDGGLEGLDLPPGGSGSGLPRHGSGGILRHVEGDGAAPDGDDQPLNLIAGEVDGPGVRTVADGAGHEASPSVVARVLDTPGAGEATVGETTDSAGGSFGPSDAVCSAPAAGSPAAGMSASADPADATEGHRRSHDVLEPDRNSVTDPDGPGRPLTVEEDETVPGDGGSDELPHLHQVLVDDERLTGVVDPSAHDASPAGPGSGADTPDASTRTVGETTDSVPATPARDVQSVGSVPATSAIAAAGTEREPFDIGPGAVSPIGTHLLRPWRDARRAGLQRALASMLAGHHLTWWEPNPGRSGDAFQVAVGLLETYLQDWPEFAHVVPPREIRGNARGGSLRFLEGSPSPKAPAASA